MNYPLVVSRRIMQWEIDATNLEVWMLRSDRVEDGSQTIFLVTEFSFGASTFFSSFWHQKFVPVGALSHFDMPVVPLQHCYSRL